MPSQLILTFLILALFLIFLYFVPVSLYITALFSGVRLEIMELVFMRIRKSPVREIVNSLIVSSKLGLGLTREDLEVHALAGGDVTAVVKTLGIAKQKGINISFKEVSAWDLANENLEEMLDSQSNASNNDQLKIELLNRIKILTNEQLIQVKQFFEKL